VIMYAMLCDVYMMLYMIFVWYCMMLHVIFVCDNVCDAVALRDHKIERYTKPREEQINHRVCVEWPRLITPRAPPPSLYVCKYIRT
jgi:hypothetical protein